MLEVAPLDGPSLVALRAFEAAARYGSFRRAAEELHVSPAAVAQHVKAIEAWAEQPLFDRSARGVALNEAGVRVRPALTDAFQRLATAANQLREGNPERRTVRIAALPSVAQRWFTPRLSELRQVLPGLDIAVHAVDRKPDLHRDGFDLTAYYESAGDHSDELILVTAPSLADGLTELDDLASIPRLIDRTWASYWDRWAGPDASLASAPVVELSLFAMAADAAIRGDGVLVGRLSLLADLIASGSLVEPFDRRIATGDRLVVRRRNDDALAALGVLLEARLP